MPKKWEFKAFITAEGETETEAKAGAEAVTDNVSSSGGVSISLDDGPGYLVEDWEG